MTAVTSAPTTLARSRDALTPALRAALGRLDAASALVAAYHLGWVDADGHPGAGDGGKSVRGALALASARAVGAGEEVALPGAVAVELVHNFSLLHDDLIDRDAQRRHRATVWALHGVPAAVLVGDAMLALATEVLLDAATPQAAQAARMLAVTTRELVRGQTEDVAFERRRDVTPAQCRAMAAGKTGALLETSAAIGAVLAGAQVPVSAAQVEALSAYGRHVGVAFQLVDDLLGIWGDPAVTGKPVLADLRARKMSLPVTCALASPGPAASELARWYATTPGADDEAALERAAELVEATGARAWVVDEAERAVAGAHEALRRAPLRARARAELDDLADHLARRDA